MNEANENMNHENDKVTIDEKKHIVIVKSELTPALCAPTFVNLVNIRTASFEQTFSTI
jgi:hypothetical protein